MFRLTREVRFAVYPDADMKKPERVWNGHAGFPPLTGLGYFFTVQVTVAGALDPASGYLINIKEFDEVVRRDGVPLFEAYVRRGRHVGSGALAQCLFDHFRRTWPGLARSRIGLSPYTSLSVTATEYPMVRFSQKFEFSAAHRLHNPALPPDANAATYGKCNNPHGHGHNYELQVTLRGKPDASGQLLPIQKLEEIVATTVIDKFDHKNLNVETPEFMELIPTVENIAMVIYRLLKPKIAAAGAELAAVTVWETPKTWCEYSE